MAKRGDKTRHKLAEAEFFLGQLKANYGKLKKFDYFLSAFITSARSVTWVMGNEYCKVDGWKQWWRAKKPSQEEAALLKGTNAVRVRTEKLAPLKTASIFFVQGIKLTKEDATKLSSALAKAKGQKIPIRLSGTTSNYSLEFEIAGERFSYPATEVLADRRLKDFPRENILKVCERYYEAVATVVRECGEKFDA